MAKFKVSINPDSIKTCRQLGNQAEYLFDLQSQPKIPKAEIKALQKREMELRWSLYAEATKILKEWGY